MDPVTSPSGSKDFETVELEDLSKQKQPKPPRRTIYFASGETMEEYSTDEEDEEEAKKPQPVTVDASKLTWGPYFFYHMWKIAASTLSVCDYLGERMASLFGITAPKYQYAINEYYRTKQEEEEEEEENQLSEEAERRFKEQQHHNGQQPLTEQPEASTSFVNMNFEQEEDPQSPQDLDRARRPS